MKQRYSSSTNPGNGLNVKPALSPDEKFDKIVNKLSASTDEVSTERKVKILSLATVLLAIACHAFDMSDFQIMDECATKQVGFVLRSMSRGMMAKIGMMVKMKILKVRHFTISFSSLMELCGKLPWLETLFFTIEAERNFAINDVETFQKAFGQLHTFQFSSPSNESELDEDFQKSLTLECVRYLPNLKRVGVPGKFVDMFPACLDYQSLDSTGQSKLTLLELRVNRDVGKIAPSKFPDIEYLHIKWEDDNHPSVEYDVSKLLEFKHLTNLTMSCLGSKHSVYIKQFLDVYGKHLTSLYLQFLSHPIDFITLFIMIFCNSLHRLEKLHIINLDVQLPVARIGEVSCESLTWLDLEFNSEQSSKSTHVHLSKILSVPNLEKVTLTRVPTTLDELWETMVLITRGTILKKVTRFELELSKEQMIEDELIARTKCCQTIKEEMLSDKKEGFSSSLHYLRLMWRGTFSPPLRLRPSKAFHSNSYLTTFEARKVSFSRPQSNFSSINRLKLWIKMEQIASSSNNPENGLNLQLALPPDEAFVNFIKILFNSTKDKTIEQKKQILAKRCSEITKINFAKVMALFPEDDNLIITDILITIASNAKNMSDFQIIDESATRQKITVRSMSEEMELCGMLPSLKKLFFKIEALPNFAIDDIDDFQKRFGHLREFLFSSVSNEKRLQADFRKSLTLKCIRYLPKLRILGDPAHFVDMFPTCLEYQTIATSKKRGLKNFAIKVDRDIKENMLSKFPDVCHLQIKWAREDHPSGGYQLFGQS
ncbi:Hypothetical predicted protein [Cloeon dipterum]|uniref:Uncharacterized protein n=1 Tax=Cloeon dipterum TaxID=197152 RepID=A0A8S1C789_9INSE|nr:Hypothetical predicted protein [Cloeon dipterum]